MQIVTEEEMDALRASWMPGGYSNAESYMVEKLVKSVRILKTALENTACNIGYYHRLELGAPEIVKEEIADAIIECGYNSDNP